MYDLCYEDDWRTLPGSSLIFESRDPRMIMLEGDVRPTRYSLAPLTPVLPDAKDRILTEGYSYNPVHTEIYGNSGRGIAAQRKNKFLWRLLITYTYYYYIYYVLVKNACMTYYYKDDDGRTGSTSFYIYCKYFFEVEFFFSTAKCMIFIAILL